MVDGCKKKVWDYNPCGRPLYDDEHCIFHSHDIEGKKEQFKDGKTEAVHDFMTLLW